MSLPRNVCNIDYTKYLYYEMFQEIGHKSFEKWNYDQELGMKAVMVATPNPS